MKKFEVPSPVLAVMAILAWSSAIPAVKTALLYGEPTLTAALRFSAAGIVSLLLGGRFRDQIISIFANWKQALIVSFGAALQYYLFFLSLSLIRGSLAAVINGTSPIVVTLIVPLFMKADTLSFKKTLALTVGFLGVALAAFGKGGGTGFGMTLNTLWGSLILLLSVLVGAVLNILTVRSGTMKGRTLVGVEFFLASIALFFVVLVKTRGHISFPAEPIYYIMTYYLSFVTIFAFNIFIYLVKMRGMKVSTMAIYRATMPVLGMALSWIFVKGDLPNVISIAGATISLVAILSFLITQRKKQA